MRVAESLLFGALLGLLVAPTHATLMSTGADGSFRPTAAVVLDPAPLVFNFTDIYIPAGVAVSFGELSLAQPIQLLARGNIEIAGTLDAGSNSLRIETPGSISLTGVITAPGGTIILVAGSTIDVTGEVLAGGFCPTGCGTGQIIGPRDISITQPIGSPSTVSEPEALALLGLGLAAMVIMRRSERHLPSA